MVMHATRPGPILARQAVPHKHRPATHPVLAGEAKCPACRHRVRTHGARGCFVKVNATKMVCGCRESKA